MPKAPKNATKKAQSKRTKAYIHIIGDGTNKASLVFPKGVIAQGKQKLAVDDVVKLLTTSRAKTASAKACSPWCVDNCPTWNPPCHSWVCTLD